MLWIVDVEGPLGQSSLVGDEKDRRWGSGRNILRTQPENEVEETTQPPHNWEYYLNVPVNE